MGIFDILKPQSKDTQAMRRERVNREGSPYYTWQVPVLAAGVSAQIHIPTQFPDSRKYEPLDWIEVANAEVANALTLTINSDMSLPVPVSSIRTVDNEALWNIVITNNGAGAITLGKVIVTLQKQPLTADKKARGA